MFNPTSVRWKHFLLAAVLICTSPSTSSRPPKIDLGVIVDTSAYMTNSTFNTAVQLIKNFANHLSISPSSTRVGVYTISNELVERFPFNKYVNRECLLAGIKVLSMKNRTLLFENRTMQIPIKSRQFYENRTTELLHEGLSTLKRKSTEVFGQRRIFIFVTTSRIQMLKLKEKTIKSRDNDVYTILIGTNRTKELNKFKIRSKFFVYFDKKDYSEIAHKLKLDDKDYSACDTKGPTTDECERKCRCFDGKLTRCYRERKEITAMSSYERIRFLHVYKKLTSLSPYKERYEKFIFMHFKYFCYGIHGSELFLPWHRWYVSEMENLLRQIDCRVTIPYWNWAAMSMNPWNTTTLWSEKDDGLGGNGEKYKGYCVQTGMFRESEWETPYWEDPLQIMTTTIDQLNGDIDDQRANLAYCLRRGFHGHIPGTNSVRNVLKIPARKFRDFNLHIIHNYHNKIHNGIGGTMSTDYAANTPEFFLHHAFLDKIWYMWQAQSDDHKYVHFLQRNITKMMGCNHTQRELIDSHDLPGCINVRYTDIPEKANVRDARKREKRLKDDIDDMSRTPHAFWDPYLRDKWDDVFPSCDSSDRDKKRAHHLHLKIDLPGADD